MPSSPNYKRNYKQEDLRDKERGKVGTGHNSDTAIRERDRRKALKLGIIKKTDTLDHATPLSKEKNKANAEKPSNWRPETPHDNYSYPRNPDGSMIVNRSPTKGQK